MLIHNGDHLEQEGWDARSQFQDFSDNPYTRDTVEWEAWRKGWVEADVNLSPVYQKASDE